jgi:hypothetical protein
LAEEKRAFEKWHSVRADEGLKIRKIKNVETPR